jgi:uncharacterized protein
MSTPFPNSFILSHWPRTMHLLALLLPLIVACTTPAAAVPPPLEQTAANCESPTYASDVRVCGDPLLRALDARMRDAWAALDLAGVVAPEAWVEPQQAWFKRRSLCAFSEHHADCLQGAYRERIAVLEALRLVASRPRRAAAPATCAHAPWGGSSVRIRAPATGALTIEIDDARVLVAATPPRAGSAWTPFVAFTVEGPSIRLLPISGPAITCTPERVR